jgi:hypothetical protein
MPHRRCPCRLLVTTSLILATTAACESQRRTDTATSAATSAPRSPTSATAAPAAPPSAHAPATSASAAEAPSPSPSTTPSAAAAVSGTPAPSSSGAIAVGPGCIADPPAHLRAHLTAQERELMDMMIGDAGYEQPLEDIDGDGVAERMLAWTCGATGNCQYRLYASNRGCTKVVGAFGALSVTLSATRHHGLLDLEVWTKGGCAGLEGTWERYVFDGNRYAVVETKECPCPPGMAAPKCTAQNKHCPCE